ncbi:MAG: biotin/lipoyl-binding protein [Pseudomonadota bacterium]
MDASPASDAHATPAQGFASLIELEQSLRAATTLPTFRFAVVNNTANLISYNQAILFARRQNGALQAQAASHLATVDPHAPYIRFLVALTTIIGKSEQGSGIHTLSQPDIQGLMQDGKHREDLSEWPIKHLLWIPLIAPDKRFIGVLALIRNEPFAPSDLTLANFINQAIAHAWAALLPRGGHDRLWHKTRLWVGAAVVVLACMAIPIHQSALAPATVVPRAPDIITAPISGIIETVHVQPNSFVSEGDLLITFDDTELRNQSNITQKMLSVAKTMHLRASQQAFNDPQGRAELSVLSADIDLRQAELDYTQEQLARIQVRADRNGVVIFRDTDDLTGQSVEIGEILMTLAQPEDTELEIELPVADALEFADEAPVRLFLNSDPTNPVNAVLVRSDYQARPTHEGTLAYYLLARFHEGEALPRLGMRGTARILSQRTSLGYFLLRRPLAFLRSTLGL